MRAPDFWYPEYDKGEGRFAAFALAPLGWLYGLAGIWRWRFARPYKPTIPVICLGNLTAGGTGKTPLCQFIAGELSKSGETVAIVSRGYGGRLKGPVKVDKHLHSHVEVGDEPLMLAQQCDVFIGKDRAKAVMLAEQSGASVIVMDDGFQNPTVEKAVSILVVDKERQFGNQKLIPAGPLREFKTRGMARADGVIEMASAEDADPKTGNLSEAGERPRFGAHLKPLPIASNIAGRQFVAFAGIGNPDQFFDTLSALGAKLAECVPYPDHHPFYSKDFAFLTGLARERNAQLITTAKDAARLPRDMLDQVEIFHVGAEIIERDAFNSFLQMKLREARA